MKKMFLFLFVMSFLYVFLLTAGIPFYWHDYINIYLLSGAWQQNSLTYGFEFAFRPLENLIHFLFFHLFGVVAFPFRILKAIMAAGTVLGIFVVVEKDTGERSIAWIAAIFYLTLSSLLQSVMLIYDFEIVVQFFLLLSFYFFFKMYGSESLGWKDMLAFMTITTLAIFTKESAKVFVAVLFLFVLLGGRRKWKYLLAVLFLLGLAINPGIFFGVNASSGSMISILASWYSLGNFVLFMKYLVVFAFGVLVAVVIAIGVYIHKKNQTHNFFNVIKEKMYEMRYQPILFFGLWFLATAVLTAVVPMADKRYAIVPLLPFTIVSFMCIGRVYRSLIWRRWLYAFFLILICITIAFNVGMALKYRYGFGNFFILLDESYVFTEKNYNQSIFYYSDSIAHFYNFFTLTTNNEYWEYYYFNESVVYDKDVFFYALVDKLQIKEKKKATLEATFLKGPQCFMLYKLQEEEIAEFSLNQTEQQTFSYTFSEQKQLSYCSVSVETRFLVPQEIEVTVIGENENMSTIITPPLGKYKACEYLCPIGNVTKVEVTTKDSFFTELFNEIYSAEVRIIEE